MLNAGATHTGVTAVVPHAGNLFVDKPLAACAVLNGFGKSVGLVQIAELGTLETPILLTNTFSVGTCANALIRRAIRQNPEIGRTTSTVNPVVMECNDGYLSDIQAMAVSEADAEAAIELGCGGLRGGCRRGRHRNELFWFEGRYRLGVPPGSAGRRRFSCGGAGIGQFRPGR